MASKFLHEELYRGRGAATPDANAAVARDALARLAELRVVICGAGAIGSNLADNLARQGFTSLCAIDHDRIEEHNVGTQLYGESEVGVWKVEALRNRLFRAVGVELEAVRKELAAQNAGALLKGAGLVIDAFDNSASRALVQQTCRAANTPCLHVGLFEDYCEVVWDEHYRVPNDPAPQAGAVAVCDYPLARNLVLLSVAIASEVVMGFALDGSRAQWSATLRDFAIREVP
jgi:molybdopterin/thiamine biosynthesis adenylyltransferase